MSSKKARQLGALLKHHREAAGLSFSEVGRRVGVPPSTVQRYERGEMESPDPYKLLRLARVLQIDVEEIYELTELTAALGLPEVPVYLRQKFDDLSDDEVAKVERYIARLRKQAAREDGDAEPAD